MDAPTRIARTVLEGFDKHYGLFRPPRAQGARERFERDRVGRESAEPPVARASTMYERERVVEAVGRPSARASPRAARSRSSTRRCGRRGREAAPTSSLLYGHRQPECAETFYNSVALPRPSMSLLLTTTNTSSGAPRSPPQHLDFEAPTYRCYYPRTDGLARCLRRIAEDFGLHIPFDDLTRDLRRVLGAARRRAVPEEDPPVADPGPVWLLYRNRLAHAVGRIVNGSRDSPSPWRCAVAMTAGCRWTRPSSSTSTSPTSSASRTSISPWTWRSRLPMSPSSRRYYPINRRPSSTPPLVFKNRERLFSTAISSIT